MGLLDSLFGSGKKAETPKPKPVAAAPAAVVSETVETISPEVIAAISASIGMIMEDAGAELAAAIAAVILHSKGGGCRAVSIKRSSYAWAASGRQKIMDGRQMF